MSGKPPSPVAFARRIARRVLPAGMRKGFREHRRRRIASRNRAALLAADPSLRVCRVEGREFTGRLAERFTAAEAAEVNLRIVAEAAEAAGIDYFLVPGRAFTRHAVGIRVSDKQAFLEAMRRRYDRTEVYAARVAAAGADIGVYGEAAMPRAVGFAQTIRFGRFTVGPQGRLLAGLDYGCDVEFWRDGAEFTADSRYARKNARLKVQVPASMLGGALVAPRPNLVADVLPPEELVPAEISVGGHKYPSFRAFTRRLVDTVDFPVDAVYMWVDGNDPDWAARRARHLGGDAADHTHLTGASRYVSRDELKYSLRSLHTFAPFIRNVFIVTDGQIPDWLDTDAPGISVVDHAAIYADPSVLPVFSSHAIATQLHRIPGLADHYLILNDDVFFGSPSRAEKFFHASGLAQLPFSPLQIGLGEARAADSAPNSAGKNVRALLEPDFGRMTTSKFKHIPHPQSREAAFEMAERYADAVAATARSRFRDPADIEFVGMLHHYSMLTGRAVPGSSRLHYVDISHLDAAGTLDRLAASRSAEYFCLNDVDTPPEREAAIGAMVRRFLDDYFPFPSPYEKT